MKLRGSVAACLGVVIYLRLGGSTAETPFSRVHKYGLPDFTRPKMIRQSAALSLLKTNPCVPIWPGRGMLEVEEYTTLHCHVFRGALHAYIHRYLYHRMIMTVCTTYYISSTIVQFHFLPPSAESEVGSSCLATIMSPSVAVTMAMSISPFSVSAHVSILASLLSSILLICENAAFESDTAKAGCQRSNLAHRPSQRTSKPACRRTAYQCA